MPDYVPALQARMGDWQYYVTVMKLGKIARECRLADDIHPNKDLDALIQRELQNRVQQEMVPYLLNQSQRFYGAMVVAVYGGEPEFSPVRVDEHQLIDDKERSSYGFGLLRFDGSQIYYALDGQHRLKSIQEAIILNPDLAKEQITVIVLKHEDTYEGLQRTRRLFSTLNRRAKPTTSGTNIAIDEDDSIAIVTRRLVKENDILKTLVLTKLGSTAISPNKSNDPYITTIAAFYETNELLIGAYNGGIEINKSFKQFRRSDDEIDGYYSFLESIWMRMLEKCPGFDSILNGKKKPGDIRRRLDANEQPEVDDTGKPIAGGSVFARPIGQHIIAEVLKSVSIQGKSIEDAIDTIMANISMDIERTPWVGVIWNPTMHRILSNKSSERTLIASIISHAIGLKISLKIRDLKQKYRDTIGDQKAVLLPPINWSGRNINTVSEEDSDADDGNE